MSFIPRLVDWRFDPFTESWSAVAITGEIHRIPGSFPYRIRLLEVPREDSPSTVEMWVAIELDEDLDNSETGVDIVAGDYAKVSVGDILLVDDEQLYIDAKPGSPTLTVQRGYGGTTPATHNTGTQMKLLSSFTEITGGSPAAGEFRVEYKYNTALILFNAAKADYDVWVNYYGLGTPLFAELMGEVRGLAYCDEEQAGLTAGAWADVTGHNVKILLPKGARWLKMMVRGTRAGAGQVHSRVSVDGTSTLDGTTIDWQTTFAAWYGPSVVDVSSLEEEWVTIHAEAYCDVGVTTYDIEASFFYWEPSIDEVA